VKLDRWLALLFLIICLIYGVAAFNFPLLPFERNMSFLPNTLPKALSVLGAAIALIILLSPRSSTTDEEGIITLEEVKNFELARAISLLVAMVLYAILLRPIGFLAATILFIVGTSVALGERKFYFLIPIATIAAFLVWYLVQQTLGIYLRPWPAMFGV
jgi:putative tricarboxylic transport membrane protein